MTPSNPGIRQVSQFDRLIFRFGPSIVGLYMFAILWLLFVLGDREFYYDILKWWGIMPYHYPFVDMKIIFMNIDCWRHGVDVFVRNICVNGGWYSYSPILLWAGALPIEPSDHIWFGILFGITFLMALSALPPCQSWNECCIRSLATISTVTVFGVERTEFDLPIFLIVMTGIVLLLRTSRVRLAAYAVLVFAALLKYYPAVLMLLAARERFRTAVWIAVATIVATLIFLAPTMELTNQALEMAPVGSPFANEFFGARNIPLGVTLLAAGPLPLTDDALLRIPLSLLGQVALGLLLLFAALTIWRRVRTDVRQLPVLPDAELTFLVAGCVVMVGCFFAVQNAGPRAVFLLMVLPGLLMLAKADDAGRRPMLVVYGTLLLLWEGFFHGLVTEFTDRHQSVAVLNFFYWLARELVWWWVMARLASLVIAFLWRSPALAPVLAFVRLPRPA